MPGIGIFFGKRSLALTAAKKKIAAITSKAIIAMEPFKA